MKDLTFAEFLDKKPLYYKEIDHERVHVAYRMLKPHIDRPKTVHVVGTNGKGSTGRMISHLAYQGAGLSVGHFSSPHILKFNERIWMNGSDASDEVLEAAHQKLFAILGEKMSHALSYFEYTTLLAFVVFENCDLMVLEAGLGGEFDATNVCDKELSVITPIGIDHQVFLGDSIEEIAATKIRSIQSGAKVLIAPQPYEEVVEVAAQIAEKKGVEFFLSEQKAETREQLEYVALEKSWGSYLVDNAMVALQALDILNIPYDIEALGTLELFGRFYPLTKNIRIDVGHNPLAAKAIVGAMEPDTVLIYNSLDDKDYEEVLRTLKPKVKRVEIIRIDSQRATTVKDIEAALEKVGLPYSDFQNSMEDDQHYLVFGSFYTVEAFLKKLKIKN
ncbi:bifunctional folylpolyglutamate synthase/dihydrofolate synthase [Sulfurovum sp. NBC37-1]|uniref:bifunctional folylpolyglutamate synthase/dihydrofolate synthase n=1 Tax=Sulfurovum sp. (strain NBC37-1) TaxID=387093 RepID=UPI0001587A12|nr:Mur ligase family protein [Sulfurovum sp. NBC37-1]BAF72983.1 folylpolyglutamate synthase [Sulfurovum sp. NBC37-1]